MTNGDGRHQPQSARGINNSGAGRAPRSASRVVHGCRDLAREQVQVVLDLIDDAVLGIDLNGKINFMNQLAERMTGWSRSEALGQPVEKVFEMIDSVTYRYMEFPGLRAIRREAKVELSNGGLLLHRDGSEVAIEDTAAPVHDQSGRVIGAVVVFHDARFSRATAARMAHLAQHDWLTGLPNRAALIDRLNQALALARRHDKQVGVLFLDLDNFKHVNDTFGHAWGDQVLVALSRKLVECVRETDTVSRYGGDEFVVLLSEIEQPAHAVQVATKLRKAVRRMQLPDGHACPLSVSVGASIYPVDGVDIDALLKQADGSMYRAKAGKALEALKSL